jgi:hypothetical protein
LHTLQVRQTPGSGIIPLASEEPASKTPAVYHDAAKSVFAKYDTPALKFRPIAAAEALAGLTP